MNRGQRPPEDRISLGSIPARQLGQHFLVFSVGSLLMLAVRVYNGVVMGGDPAWHQVIDLVGEKGGSTMAACLGLSAISVEGVNMVLAELFRRRRREEDLAEGEARGSAEGEARGLAEGEARGLAEGEARGLVEGQAQMHRLWMEWLHRKEAAESEGVPFGEPPPQPENLNGRDS